MNKKILSRLIFGASLLLLAACTKDEIMDDNALPEEKYPLKIASASLTADVSEQPWGAKAAQTRVAENTDGTGSVWQAGDKIKVQIGDGTPGTYTYQSDGTLIVVDGTRPAYWTSKANDQTIKAWYTSSGGETVDLSNQTNGFAYIVTAQKTANFNTAVPLSFSHALAKVCVYLRGTAYDGSNDNGVTLSYPASCSVADGKVTSSGTNSTIQMHKADGYYEALVPPGTIATNGNPFTVTLNGTTVSINLSASLTLAAGSMHNVTLLLHNKSGTKEIDLSKQSAPYTINADGDYYFYGSGSYGIKVTGGNPNIYLDDATVSVNSGNAVDITNGSPTIHVQGSNTMSTKSGAGIYIAQNNTVTITSTNRDNKLNATGGNGGNGIGGYTTKSGYSYTSANSGNISISSVTMCAQGSDYDTEVYAPGIGGAGSASCGTITIDNATVYAYGTGKSFHNMTGAAIGGGIYANAQGSYSIITINNGSEVYVQRGNHFSDYIGHSGSRDYPAIDEIDAIVDGTSKITKLN